MNEPFVCLHPVFVATAVLYLHSYLLKLLLILVLCNLGLQLAAVNVFLQREQYLVGVYRLDQVVGNLLSDGLVHDVLLLTLGDHHHGRGRRYFLDALQRFQSAQTRHLLIE